MNSATTGLAALAVLAASCGVASAQTATLPDRGPEIMQLQLQSRATRPPPPGMDGAQASAIYKRLSQGDTHSAPPPPSVAMDQP